MVRFASKAKCETELPNAAGNDRHICSRVNFVSGTHGWGQPQGIQGTLLQPLTASANSSWGVLLAQGHSQPLAISQFGPGVLCLVRGSRTNQLLLELVGRGLLLGRGVLLLGRSGSWALAELGYPNLSRGLSE